jgi:hypothetical protein
LVDGFGCYWECDQQQEKGQTPHMPIMAMKISAWSPRRSQ